MGGAISSEGQVTVRSSVLTGNVAQQGGAVAGDTVMVDNTTASDNVASVEGGGLFARYVRLLTPQLHIVSVCLKFSRS